MQNIDKLINLENSLEQAKELMSTAKYAGIIKTIVAIKNNIKKQEKKQYKIEKKQYLSTLNYITKLFTEQEKPIINPQKPEILEIEQEVLIPELKVGFELLNKSVEYCQESTFETVNECEFETNSLQEFVCDLVFELDIPSIQIKHIKIEQVICNTIAIWTPPLYITKEQISKMFNETDNLICYYHPDKNRSSICTQIFQMITLEYSLLSIDQNVSLFNSEEEWDIQSQLAKYQNLIDEIYNYIESIQKDEDSFIQMLYNSFGLFDINLEETEFDELLKIKDILRHIEAFLEVRIFEDKQLLKDEIENIRELYHKHPQCWVKITGISIQIDKINSYQEVLDIYQLLLDKFSVTEDEYEDAGYLYEQYLEEKCRQRMWGISKDNNNEFKIPYTILIEQIANSMKFTSYKDLMNLHESQPQEDDEDLLNVYMNNQFDNQYDNESDLNNESDEGSNTEIKLNTQQKLQNNNIQTNKSNNESDNESDNKSNNESNNESESDIDIETKLCEILCNDEESDIVSQLYLGD